ncbi:hypothetical protein ACSQ67_025268 [Phaseolus vulgaris]
MPPPQRTISTAQPHHRKEPPPSQRTVITVATATTVVPVRRRSTNAHTATITTARRFAFNGHHRVTFSRRSPPPPQYSSRNSWDRKTFRIRSRKEDESLLPPELRIIGISSQPNLFASTRLPYVFTTKFQLHQFIAPHILLLQPNIESIPSLRARIENKYN